MKAKATSLVGLGVHPVLAAVLGSEFGGIATGLTAAGSAITDALALTKTVNIVGTAEASTGVQLPNVPFDANSPTIVLVTNGGSNTINIFPESATATITAGATTGSGGAASTLATTKTKLFIRSSATDWQVIALD